MITKGLLAGVVAMAMVAWWFYTSNLQLKNDLQTAIIKVEAVETSLRTAEQEQELLAIQMKQFTAKMAVMEMERNQARVQVNKMRDLFQDHDFAKLLSRKPGLIENLMIKKTQEVFDEIETLTAP